MKTRIIFIMLLFASLRLGAQGKSAVGKMDFDGYIQVRAGSNFDDRTGFSLRRLKLWLKPGPDFSEHWFYKLQCTFSSLAKEKFFLQDVKGGYKRGRFTIEFGQFVPQYSLQRFQPDYKLPAIERAIAVNALIPDGTLGVRDLGVQGAYAAKSGIFETWFGLFNGYGIKEYRFDNQGYMFTHKSAFNIKRSDFRITAGYSLQYRHAENLQLRYIFPDSVLYSGNDFRYNLFALFRTKSLWLQAEYLSADFEGQKAGGYYFLSAFDLGRNQFVASVEAYRDLIAETVTRPVYRMGYNFSFREYKLKLFFDNYFQIAENKIDNYYASVQLQMFFK